MVSSAYIDPFILLIVNHTHHPHNDMRLTSFDIVAVGTQGDRIGNANTALSRKAGG